MKRVPSVAFSTPSSTDSSAPVSSAESRASRAGRGAGCRRTGEQQQPDGDSGAPQQRRAPLGAARAASSAAMMRCEMLSQPSAPGSRGAAWFRSMWEKEGPAAVPATAGALLLCCTEGEMRLRCAYEQMDQLTRYRTEGGPCVPACLVLTP
ncbi:hypothetical protein INR49_018500 [Caranx melampygus]|nr:hypothetical protein INR49_018500 [Caranx melampygus]